MRKFEKVTVEQEVLKSVVCDVCKREFDVSDQMELQEFLTIDFIGGFTSVFGDGTKVRGEICQYCVQRLLGAYLHMTV